jgi:release factor glutamine methyltransferase
VTAPFQDLTTAELTARLRAAGCVYAEEEAAILLGAAGTAQELDDMAARRVKGFPLEHIVGWAAFHGLRIKVAPGVFVPRLRTEFLVREAAAILRREGGTAGGGGNAVVLDLCCGSGAIGAALAAELPRLEIHAADIDPAAVACAAANLALFTGAVHCGDLFEPLPAALRGRFRIITANAPYVPTQDIAFMPQEARLFEPDEALDGGADGLDIQRRIAGQAREWLRPGGHLIVESSPAQAAESVRILERNGFRAASVHSEQLDGTAVIGRRGG